MRAGHVAEVGPNRKASARQTELVSDARACDPCHQWGGRVAHWLVMFRPETYAAARIAQLVLGI